MGLVKELLEDTKLRSTNGPGRWLSSLTMLGSVVEPSSLRTMSSPLLTALKELLTSTSWPELTMLEHPQSLTVLRSPPTMAGLTHNGTTTHSPTMSPSLNCHRPLTSTTTSLLRVCPLLATLLMSVSWSPALDGESPLTLLEESLLSSGWSRTVQSSATLTVTLSTELLYPESSVSTLLEERELAMVTLVAPLT